MKPVCNITVDGKPVSDLFMSRLVSVSVSDKEGLKSDTVNIALNDGHPFVEIPRKGAKISVSIGYEGQPIRHLGDFVADEVKVKCLPYSLEIQGKAADMRETLKEKKNRHWDKKTVKDIVSEIASDHGLTPAISDEVGAHEYEWFGQLDESDMNLVDRLAKRHNALFTVKQGRLVFAKKGSGEAASGSAIGQFTITPDMIIPDTCEITNVDRGSYGKVVAYYQDKDKAEREEIEVKSAVSDAKAIYRLREAFASREEAEKAATAKSNTLDRGGLATSVGLIGDSSIRGGASFTYSGVRPGVDGIPFIIETAEHKFTKPDAYRMTVSGKVKSGEGEGSAKKAATTNGTTRAKKEASDAAAGGNPSTGTGGGNLQPGGGSLDGEQTPDGL